MQPFSALQKELTGLERELVAPETRHHPERLRTLLHPEFREFGSSGRVWTREALIADLRVENTPVFRLLDWQLQPVGEGAALLTYRAQRLLEDGSARSSLHSSLWVFEEGRWQMLFHQGTGVP